MKKIPSNTTYKACEASLQEELQTIAQGNQRGHKEMEKHSMFMVRKNQYCENGHTAQRSLHFYVIKKWVQVQFSAYG